MTESTEITSLCSYTEYEVDSAEPSFRSVGARAVRAARSAGDGFS